MPRPKKSTTTDSAATPAFNEKGLFSKELLSFMTSKGMLPIKVGDFSFVRSGLYSLDAALNGGFVRGWVTEIAGGNDRGKSTLAQIVTANAAMVGYRVAYIDHEGTLVSRKWMRDMGIPLNQIWDGEGDYEDKLIHIFHPASLERGLEFCRRVARANIYDIIIYDSVGRAPTETMVEAEIKTTAYSPQSRVLADFSTKITEAFTGSRSSLILINTVYTNTGQDWFDINHPVGKKYVSKADSTVGFMCGHRLWMLDPKAEDYTWEGAATPEEAKAAKAEGIVAKKKSENARWLSRRFPVSLWKSKSSPHPNVFGFRLHYNPGTGNYQVDVANDIFETAKALGIIEVRGAYLFMDDKNIGSGAKNIEKLVREDPEFAKTVIEKIEDAIAGNLAAFNANDEGGLVVDPDDYDSDEGEDDEEAGP